LVLAQCLRDAQDCAAAFAAYERIRRPRVEQLMAQARRRGNQKTVANPVVLWLRDHLLPFFIKRGARASDWVYGHDIDLNARVA
jgi:2-polyprenyl-6-methoxyphenol hydroxylase-like FAD-dependent oxidoreductase